jgi:hypothetical protein
MNINLHFFLVLILFQFCDAVVERNFTKRCGECWWYVLVEQYMICLEPHLIETRISITSSSECPAFEEGYYDSLPAIYNTFVLVDPSNTLPMLKSASNNTDCFPFPSLASQLLNIPQSQWDICAPPPLADDANAVCAFVYNVSEPVTNISTCINRKYQLKTFSTREAAVSSGATITHTRGKVFDLQTFWLFSLFHYHSILYCCCVYYNSLRGM